jgi:hypothetical protein
VEQREGAGIVVAFLISLLAHASPQLPSLLRRLEPKPIALLSWQPSLATPLERIDFRSARMTLVADARKQRDKLELGAFLIDAAAIDAAERGVGLERDRAVNEYKRRLSKVRATLQSGSDVQTAFAGAFGDMHYRGIAGGTIAEALIDGGGSCEPLSLLFAAALHDAGYGEHAFLRHYGGGVPHLAPIYLHFGSEHDIMAGGPAHPGGLRFLARDLVEVYAIAHGLPGKLATWRGPPAPKTKDKEDIQPPAESLFSLAAGYPQNGDRYPGTVALYAEHALASPTEAGPIGASGGTYPEEWHTRCSTSGTQLFRAQVAVLTSEPYSVELFDLPLRGELGSRAWWAARWEAQDVSKKSIGEQLVWHACVSLAYDELADGFAAWSLPRLASIAADKAERQRNTANAMTEKILASSAKRKKVVKELTTAEEAWMLLAIPKADDLLLAAAAASAPNDYDLSLKRHELNAALLTHPRTRARAHERVAKTAFFEQYLTASMLRIWADGRGVQSAVPVDLGHDTEFARGYHLLTTLEAQVASLATASDGQDASVLLRLLHERVGPTWERGFREAFQKK